MRSNRYDFISSLAFDQKKHFTVTPSPVVSDNDLDIVKKPDPWGFCREQEPRVMCSKYDADLLNHRGVAYLSAKKETFKANFWLFATQKQNENAP